MTTNLITLKLPINAAIDPTFEFGISGRDPYDYTWIYVMGAIGTFWTAASTGSNDVANSWATSVGSHSLKMWQAIILASIMEFGGAFLLGGRTADTVKNNIVTASVYTAHEDLFMFGMMNTLFIVGWWNFFASYHEVNVSTTHSIIGCIVGFALCTPSGGNGVNWITVGTIFASWVVAPILTGILSCFFFVTLRWAVLRRENSFDRVWLTFPIVIFYTFFINIFFIMYNSGAATGKGLSTVKIDIGVGVGIAIGCAAGLALITYFIICPILRRRIAAMDDEQVEREMGGVIGEFKPKTKDVKEVDQVEEGTEVAGKSKPEAVNGAQEVGQEEVQAETPDQGVVPISYRNKGSAFLDKVFRQNIIHSSIHTDVVVHRIHQTSEKFSMKTEYAFGYVQVITACFASFAHGANDVGTIVGPFAGISTVYHKGPGALAAKAPVDEWILALGGAGLIFGLATFGHTIIAAMGVKLVRLTPTRGFCVELAAATITVVGTFVAIPLSSSQGFVGALAGISLAEGKTSTANGKLFLIQIASWAVTLFLMCGLSALFFSWGTFAPSQIYPLSKMNCLAFYASPGANTANGDPSVFCINSVDGQVMILYGYPTTGAITSI